MLFMAFTVVFGVLMYLFVQRVVVMKPVGIKGVDEAIDQLVERQRQKGRRSAARSWESTTLSEHTMEIIESLEATTCPLERQEASVSATPLSQTQPTSCSSYSAAAATAAASTARSMGSAAGGGRGETPLEFDKTFDPKEAVARKDEEGEKKAHRHHHKRHHRHRSRAEDRERKEGGESKERSEDSSEDGDEERRSKGGGHQKKRHRRHRSKDAGPAPRLDTPLLVPGETLPGPDVVDVEIKGQEPLKTP